MGQNGGLTSTQRGKIAELHVATALMSQSSGRLSPFEPLSDDHGIDLVVLDKESGRALPIQVKAWLLDPEKPVRTVQFDVQKTTFGKGKPGVLICVVLKKETLEIAMSWLIRMAEIPSVATDKPKKFALAPSIAEGSRDKYVPYRHLTIASLTEAVEAVLQADC
ncbi:hypothetical protein [Ruegeria denitrificans]|uniref:hypothetical protein n=1 Tax=Ruegeria denitrificans TaxID=1715692 RepID=UPI003C7D33C6